VFLQRLAFFKMLREMNSCNVEIKFPCRCRISLHYTREREHARTYTHTYSTWLSFFFFDAIPGSPWAVPRHHEEKGHTQAFTTLNRTAIKKSRKQATVRERNKRRELDLRLCLNQGWFFLQTHNHTSAFLYIRGLLSY
jgi:hypothetical protein